MRCMHFLHRKIALKSNRSQDPIVLTNIRLSNSKDLNEVFEVIKAFPLERTNRFFALRIIARMIQMNRSQVKFLQSDVYNELIENVNKSIPEIKSLELNDFSYFIKITQDYGYKNLLSDPNLFENKMNEIFKSKSLTLRQMSNLLHNGQLSGFLCEDIFKQAFSLLFSPENDYLTLMDMKNFARSMKMQRVGNNEKISLDYLSKIEQLSRKESLEVNSILYIVKSLAIIGKVRAKDLPLKSYIDKTLEQIDFFSENDYGLVFKMERDTPGTIDKQVSKILIERIQKSIEKKSARLTPSFLIDCIPILSKDPENNHLINMIVDFIIEKLQNKDLRFMILSKLCVNLIKTPREQINCVFTSKLMRILADSNYLDVLMFRSRYAGGSVFKEYNISDENIEAFINTRSLKTLIYHYINFKGFENIDINIMNEKIKMKLMNFANSSTLNARCLFGCINEMELSRELGSDSLSEFKVEIQEKLLTEFNHFNLLYLLFISGKEKNVHEYLNKYKKKVNQDVLGIALIENCTLIQNEKMNILLEVFHDSCSVNLGYCIQSIRKIPQNTSILHILEKFKECDIKKTEIYKIYTDEIDKILQKIYQKAA